VWPHTSCVLFRTAFDRPVTLLPMVSVGVVVPAYRPDVDRLVAYVDALSETEDYREWYGRVIEPTLSISSMVGNWYTGSVHIARMSALKYAAEEGIDLSGEKLLVGSYGSGAQAEIHEERIVDGWEDEISQNAIDEQLEDRYDITFEEYERVHDQHNLAKENGLEPFTQPEGEFVFDGWGPMNERKYTFVE